MQRRSAAAEKLEGLGVGPPRAGFSKCFFDLAPGLLSKLLPRQFHFDLAEVPTLASMTANLAWQNGAAWAAIAQACLARSRSGTLPSRALAHSIRIVRSCTSSGVRPSAARLPGELRHDDFQAALQIGDVRTDLIGLSQS